MTFRKLGKTRIVNIISLFERGNLDHSDYSALLTGGNLDHSDRKPWFIGPEPKTKKIYFFDFSQKHLAWTTFFLVCAKTKFFGYWPRANKPGFRVRETLES